MALVHFLVFLAFCIACVAAIHWLLKRFASSKPWHRWIRYGVWLSFIGLLTFDSIYYQIAVVHGMCKADQERVYPIPPASLVVGGPYTTEENILSSPYKNTYRWKCIQKFTNVQGVCLIDGVIAYDDDQKLPFDNIAYRYILQNIKTKEIYKVRFSYGQSAQWLSMKIFGFGIIWTSQPEKCEHGFWSPELPIVVD